jgi:hypothetical protein
MASLLIASATQLFAGTPVKEQDAAGCKDHPLFTRMQNTHIVSCKSVEFERFAFKTGKGTDTAVEGRRFDIRYQTDAGDVAPSPLAIIRNHQQAIAKIGGTAPYEDQRYTIVKVSKATTPGRLVLLSARSRALWSRAVEPPSARRSNPQIAQITGFKLFNPQSEIRNPQSLFR